MRPVPLVVCILALLISGWAVVRMSSSEVPVDTAPSALESLQIGPHATAEFDKTEHDFGQMYFGESGSHVFHVKNVGERPLNLEIGGSSCSCTVGELSDGALQPGASTEVKLEWKIKTPAREFEHSASIKTNDPENPIVQLSIRGNVLAGVLSVPPEGVDLGFIQYGKAGSAEAQFCSDTADEFQILGYEATHPWIEVTFEPMTREGIIEVDMLMGANMPEMGSMENYEPDLKSGYKLNITGTPVGERGRFNGKVVLKTDIENHPEYEVSYRGKYTGPLEFVALPGTTYIAEQMVIGGGRFSATDGKKCELLMFVRGFDEPLEFSDVTTTPDWVKAEFTRDKIQGGNDSVQRFRVKLEVPPGLPPVMRDRGTPAIISVRTNHPETEVLKLQFAFISF